MSSEGAPVRIGIDGYNLALPKGTGVATYGRNLAAAIRGLGHPLDLLFGLNIPRKVRPDLRETLFFGRLQDPSPQRMTWRRTLRRFAVKPWAQDMLAIPVEGRVLTESTADAIPPFDRLFNLSEIFDVCARYYRRYGRFMTLRVPDAPAIMHWTYPLPIRLAGAHNIYTLHDLVPLRLPQTSLEDKRYYDSLVRACAREAAHVVTVSENSRRDIIEMLNVDPARVTNAYQASHIPARSNPSTLAARLKRLFDLDCGEYFLFIGAIEPKKNLGRLIEAYLEADLKAPLVIVGGDGWHADRELKLLRGGHGASLPGTEHIRRIDYLPRSMLADLLSGARALLFPALYEGFGLPALEAMACGVPVLASTTGALPEVVGEAAILVNPYDISEIMAALQRLDNDAELRVTLAQAGLAEAQRFSPQRFQDRLNSVYQSVLAS